MTETTTSIGDAMARLKQRAEEHLSRMESDPAYRAQHEAMEAEQAKRQADFEAYRSEQVAKRKHDARLARGIPERIVRFLDSPRMTDALAAVEAFLAGDRWMLVLLGGEGCGKTAAACVGLDRAAGGAMVKAGAIARAGAFDSDLFANLCQAEVLVVDDLGVEPLDEKGWALSVIAQLLDARYDSCRKTILTSNLTPAQFATRYLDSDGGRLRGRFREAGQVVTLGGKSMRGAQP